LSEASDPADGEAANVLRMRSDIAITGTNQRGWAINLTEVFMAVTKE
jgi:hypothetical protein